MTIEIRQFHALIPAGTQQANPVRTDVSFPPREVNRIEVTVPPGPSGLVGFAIQNSNVTVIPYGSDSFIVTADEKMAWDVSGQVDSGSWQILGYDTDTNDHVIYVRFLLDMPLRMQPSRAFTYYGDLTLAGTVNA